MVKKNANCDLLENCLKDWFLGSGELKSSCNKNFNLIFGKYTIYYGSVLLAKRTSGEFFLIKNPEAASFESEKRMTEKLTAMAESLNVRFCTIYGNFNEYNSLSQYNYHILQASSKQNWDKCKRVIKEAKKYISVFRDKIKPDYIERYERIWLGIEQKMMEESNEHERTVHCH